MRQLLPVVITPSRTELGLRCYRRHALADLLQRARYASPSLEFGSVIHAGAAAHWLDDNPIMTVEREWSKRFDMNPRVTPGDLSLPMALKMVEYYRENAKVMGPFELEEGEWQLVSVEDRLEVPLVLSNGSKGTLSFQTDRVVYNKARHHLVVVDTKTASRLDRRWDRQWETSLQMKLYKAGASIAYGISPENIDVVVEGVLKNVPSSIRYVPCPDWSGSMLNEAVRQAQSIGSRDEYLVSGACKVGNSMPDKELLELDILTLTDVNYQECFSFGVECPFLQLCKSEPEDRQAILHAEFYEIPEADQGY